MPRPLRNTDPSKIHLVTCRTEHAALWMVPNVVLNEIIGGVLARYQAVCDIILYAYAVLGNHYHLLAKAPNGNLADFAEQINREIARRINWHCRREGHFWGRRYDDQIVLEDTDALEAFLYVVTNPVHHVLVRFAEQWPGLSCYQQVLSGEAREFKFTKYSEYNRARREGENPDIKHYTGTHSLILTPLPQFEKLSQAERAETLKKLIADRAKSIQEERHEQGRGFLGVKAILRQMPGRIPMEVKKSPRPCCYTRSAEMRQDFYLAERDRRDAYDEASIEFRLGKYYVVFPLFCYKPPLHKLPKVAPFLAMAV